ncbi:hypothetical protein V496_01458 [Pseudogymnoascus sp. VKM F-4515 (FW-2607)]|nr:hypothetical protein V496_01458 [Pseudogymnoascus sp. VKM F-4515 (FW-2607)]
MSSPKAPRTPLKPTNKANGTPKSFESTKKMAPAPPDGGNVVKKRIPSQNVKTNPPEHKTSSSRSKQSKASDDQLPQSPTPDQNSKVDSVRGDAPPKVKAATPNQGDAAKPVMNKVKKPSPPADVGNERQNQVNENEKRAKKTKKQVPKPQDDVGGKVKQPEQLQHSAEMAKPKFKTPDVDSGEKPKTVMKKKPAPPPEPEQESDNEDEVVSPYDGDEDQGGDYEDNENEDDYHEKPKQEDSNEEIQGDEAGSGWDEEHKTHDAEGGDDYDGNSEEEHGDVTDEDKDTLSQHGNGVSTASEKASKPARATDDAAKPAKDIRRKVQKKSTPDTSDTAKYHHADPKLLDELVKDPDAVFGEDMDALGVAHAGVPDENGDLESKGVNASNTMENTTVLQSSRGEGIGINASGTEINIQTTKDGTSVTIKILGAPKQ